MDTDQLTQDPALIFPGPIALVAGPGSGKTTRLARRIKHLVEDRKADPAEICVITFTVEAARNMKERLTPPAKEGMPDVTLPPELHPLTICTMHSLGWTIVGENATRLGMADDCRVLRPHLRVTLFEDAARLCGEDVEFGQHCADRKAKFGDPLDERECKVFDAYHRIMRTCNKIDYDDQIIIACDILKKFDEVRMAWGQKATHLLVDEYQDINRPQLELIKLLSGDDASGLFVVGDDDQSIYRFRGAEPHYIRDFKRHFGDTARVEPIPDCFRCQPHVIGAARGFIEAFNPDRISKPEPKCSKPSGPPVKVHNAPSDIAEAWLIAKLAKNALREGDVLILLPKADYAGPLKKELTKRRIAFDAPATKASEANRIFIALRDWLEDQGDNIAFRELLHAVCESGVLGIPGPRARKAEKIAEREEALKKVSALWNCAFGGRSLRDALRTMTPTGELYTRLDKIADNLSDATSGTPTDFGQRTFESLKPWPNCRQMLNELAVLPTDARGPREGDANLVRILTMRNSKGLEAETVFVVGLEDGAFPASKQGSADFEENARLFYVSMTRAKMDLHLFFARKRSGGLTHKSKSFSMKPSPFLSGLPKLHIETKYHQPTAKR